ncbi:DUF2812 domain-containing protein [Staphylococcus felis]|uniref:DUF2812 domain-containing protein n=1 Tax=Staphylococcus felis TaxID=46127 RepID=UPI002480024A|nr:DUF2812 domain-containing protein [Staphylococcus felis]
MNIETKFKLFMNPIKEEEWINKKLNDGYKLSHVSPFGFYKFEETNDKYVVRIDFRTFKKKSYEEYIYIHESLGWSCVYGSRLGTLYHYWLKKEDETLPNELFSDRSDQTEFLKRLITLMSAFAILIMIYLISSFSLDAGWIQSILHLISMIILIILSAIILNLIIMMNSRKDDIYIMKNNIWIYISKVALFVFVSFILLFLFDLLKFSDNNSGILNAFHNFSFIDIFSNPSFNGMFSLVVLLAAITIILKLFSIMLRKNK